MRMGIHDRPAALDGWALRLSLRVISTAISIKDQVWVSPANHPSVDFAPYLAFITMRKSVKLH